MIDMKAKILQKDQLIQAVAIVVGTRPGIIKFSPVIRALDKSGLNYFIVHTGQHYSYNMDKIFFDDLALPEPKFRVDVTKRAKLHGAQTAEMLKGLEKVFIHERPRLVVVGGDANTNLAAALAARKLGLDVAHMEAGLRCDDWRMPEEHNRVMIDHISDYLFAPTEQSKENLIQDNVKGKIFVVGNTIVDAVFQNIRIAQEKSNVISTLGLEGEYIVFTAHREENVDHRNILANILDAIAQISFDRKVPIIFPMHPRSRKRIKEFNLEDKLKRISRLKIIAPLGYLDFLLLLSRAQLVLTDSGGIQEECCILKIPCVTLRENTDRPETVQVGSNIIGGTQAETILAGAAKMAKVNRNWPNPFGDGKTGERITSLIQKIIMD
jgi:UDP-N-acetylglucosamine 2-epimerase (non-hydrolysing)